MWGGEGRGGGPARRSEALAERFCVHVTRDRLLREPASPWPMGGRSSRL